MTFDARDIARLVFWTFLGVFLLSLFLALALNKTVKSRTGWALGVLGFFAALIGLGYYKVFVQSDQMAAAEAKAKGLPSANERKERYAKAKALFDERCKTAGENIYRTVDDVDGILLKARPNAVNYSDQFKLDDPYGQNCGGDSCIALYLFDYKMVPAESGSGAGLVPATPRLYQYVDVDEEPEGRRYRYTKLSVTSALTKHPASGIEPRYQVVWNDISSKEDRDHWIAGGAIKIIDLKTNELIAERRGYLIDPGQGNRNGGRSPWTWARSYSNSCPSIVNHNQTFVSKVLKPMKGE